MPPTAGTPDDDRSPFHDLTRFVALPRCAGLALSPDGRRLVTVVSELDAKATTWRGALWEIDPDGIAEPRRLTRSPTGEGAPAFAADGRLLFASRRDDPAVVAGPEDKRGPRMWALPPAGEAKPVFAPRGGVGRFVTARDAVTVVAAVHAHPGVATGEDQDAKQQARTEAGVSAVLHESYPVRHWDGDLGPLKTRLLALHPARPAEGAPADGDPPIRTVDLTPDSAGRVTGAVALSPDGTLAVYAHEVLASAAEGWRVTLRSVGTDGRDDRLLADIAGTDLAEPVVLADGTAVVCVAERMPTPERPPGLTLLRIPLRRDGGRTRARAAGEPEDLLPGFDGFPTNPVGSSDGGAVFFVSNMDGRAPVFRVELATGAVTRLTTEGAYSNLCVAPDGSAVYALRTAVDAPPQPVRLDPARAGQDPVRLPAPGALTGLPGRLEELAVTVEDGRRVRAWLVLPEDAAPRHRAPLLLWVHGGPMSSWNSWTWRWNPWTAAARGYAVLLPDPALSTGYGEAWLAAGWPGWGGAPFTDLMSITDEALRRPDLDPARTAAMGGSFGGYMANWIATRTDRFRAIVTHASLWHLDAFGGTTDDAYYWLRVLGDPLADRSWIVANSPHLRADRITTPMLVIHGDKDYRVPIGEGIRLYFDLVRHGVTAKFLYFPDENHWVLSPGNSRVWYETVFAFLAEHVLGDRWRRPELL